MKYTSTRNSSISCTFEQAVTSGYAPDGGLFVPESLPSIDLDTLKKWSTFPYPELSTSILRLFIAKDELSDVELDLICQSAVSGFHESTNNVVPVRKIGSIYIAELFHGPTFCFKDLGMRVVVNLLSHYSTKRNRPTTLLVSTTGDTGPAAVQAVSDVNNPLLTILVHYPHDQISEFQRRQLTTVQSACVRVAAFQGGGDDMDLPIKRILTDANNQNTERTICGVNSYNIGRPLMQMVHFVWTYFRVVEQLGVEVGDPDTKVDIVLPTGAMGNIAGGYMAKKMGVPLGFLCAATNINDITAMVIHTGKYHKSDIMHKTLSDAINIQLPYNFERLLYYLTDGDHEQVKQWMTTVDTTKKLDFDTVWLERMQAEFRAASVTDDEMCETTRMVQEKYKYLVDPHTAVAIAAAEKLGYTLSNENRSTPVAVLSTASPCKFQESVTAAIGEKRWNEYYQNDFPEQAKTTMAKPEVKPTFYPFRKGASLEQVQTEWEAMARSILSELERPE